MSRHTVGGIHHITVLARNPQRNLDFYTKVLGLRLVKKTVNHDAPDIYHLYYGDATGRPGTILTVFPYPYAHTGRRGSGEVSSVAFQAPDGSEAYWTDRLSGFDIAFKTHRPGLGVKRISFTDPDGLSLELVFMDSPAGPAAWQNGPTPPPVAIRRLYGATLTLADLSRTHHLLSDVMGARIQSSSSHRIRYLVGGQGDEAILDVVTAPGLSRARLAAGSVHHIAWRVADETAQLDWRRRLEAAGQSVTQPVDRSYFTSIYFREPGGVLFELATDGPGFLVDESAMDLGTTLRVPSWLESRRESIESHLPPLKTIDEQMYGVY